MLQKIRDRATGPLAWFIVGIICVPFAFFGVEAFRSGGASSDVAKVGSEKISESALRQQYEQRYQQLQQMLGENFRADLINPDLLRKSVLDGLIQDAVTRQYLHSERYRIDDQAVLEFIRSQQSFQENGQFSPGLYRDRLARQGMNPIQYEDRVRSYLTGQQLRQAVSNSTVVTEKELAQAYRWEKQQRRFAQRVYRATAATPDIEIDDAQVQERYEQRKDSLLAPERLRVEYVALDRNALKDAVEVSPDALRALYDAEKESRFSIPEERLARHILIRAGDQAQAQIQDLAKRLEEGADFAELAQAHSQDPGSKKKGGDLGWVTRGMMVKPFEDALFELEKGAISAPVETDFGWHVLQLLDVREAGMRDFDEESTQLELRDLYQERIARERFDELLEQLEQLSFENPASLEPVAQALQLEVQQSEWFTREGGAGIAAEDAVVEAAFSDVVLKDKENSLPVAAGRRRVVLRLLAHEAERPQTLDEVRAELKAELVREAVAAKLEALAKADLARLESGEVKLKDLPATAVAENQPEMTVQRNDALPSRAVISALFGLEPPAPETAQYHWLTLPDGDVAVLELAQVIDGDWAKAEDTERSATRQRVLAQRANQEYAALEAALRDRTKVKIYRDSF